MKKLSFIILNILLLNATIPLFSQTIPVDEAVYHNISKTFILNEDGSQEYHYYKKMTYNTYASFQSYYGETFILYNPEYQTLKINKAFTTQVNGTVISVPENAFNPVLPSFAAKAPAYNHLKEMVVTHTGLGLGAMVELDYTITTKAGFFPFLDEMILLSEEIPVNEYNMTVKIPKGTILRYVINKNINPNVLQEEENGKDVYKWTMKNIASQPKESHLQPLTDISPLLVFSTANDFQQLLSEILQQPAFENDELPETAKIFVKKIVEENRLEIMQVLKIQEYVVNNVATIKIPDYLLGYRFSTASDTWNRNYGTVAEKTILLAAMLQEAGFSSFPGYATLENLFSMNIASNAIFNKWIVKTMLAGNKPMYLSATQITNVNMKYNYLEDHVLFPFNPKADIMRSDLFSSVSPNNQLSGSLNLSAEGTLSGHLDLHIEDGMNPYLDLEKDAEKLKSLITVISPKTITVGKKPKIDETETTITIDFSQPDAWKQRENYYFIEIPNIRIPNDALTFDPLPTKRNSSFEIQKQRYVVHINIHIPEGYALVNPKGEKESRKSFGYYKIEISEEDNVICIDRQIEISESIIAPMHYDTFRTFINEWNSENYKTMIFKKP